MPSSQNAGADSEKLQAILDHLGSDEEQRKLQLDQQADSVRYLNELNSVCINLNSGPFCDLLNLLQP